MSVRKPSMYNGMYKGRLTDNLAEVLCSIKMVDEIPQLKKYLYDFDDELVDESISTGKSVREILEERGESFEDEAYAGELRKYQTTAVGFMYYNYRAIIGDDTGTGKTYCMCGLINYMKSKNQLRGFVVVCDPTGQEQVTRDLISGTGLKVVALDGQAVKMRRQINKTDWSNVYGITIPHSALKSDEFSIFMANNLRENGMSSLANVMFIDESSVIKNVKTKTYEYTKNLCNIMQRVYLLNATTFETHLMDIVNQVEMLDDQILPSTYAIRNRYCVFEPNSYYKTVNGVPKQFTVNDLTGYKNQNELKQKLGLFYLGRSCKELGIERKAVYKIVDVTLSQKQANLISKRYYKGRYNEILNCPSLLANDPNCDIKYTREEVPKLNRLIELVEEYHDKKIMIYAFNTDSHNVIAEELTKIGRKPVIISGKVKKKDRFAIQKEFNTGNYDICISNIKKSINLNGAEVCILYDVDPSPAKVTQIVGRIDRGVDDKERTYIMMYYKDSPEEEYFINVIAERAKSSRDFTKDTKYAVDHFMDLWLEKNKDRYQQ